MPCDQHDDQLLLQASQEGACLIKGEVQLLTCIHGISRGVQAKVNETKYKGVSSEDWRSGAIGSRSGIGAGSGGMEGGFGGSRLHDDENFDYGSLTKGRGKGSGIGSSSGGKTPSDDAVAATKARIDALRKDGNLDESPRKADAIPAVSGLPPLSTHTHTHTHTLSHVMSHVPCLSHRFCVPGTLLIPIVLVSRSTVHSPCHALWLQ